MRIIRRLSNRTRTRSALALHLALSVRFGAIRYGNGPTGAGER